jgi:hypothetical protein
MELNPSVEEVLYRDLSRCNRPFWEDDRLIQLVVLTLKHQQAYVTHINNIVTKLLNEKNSDSGPHTFVGCCPNGDRDNNVVLFITLKKI